MQSVMRRKNKMPLFRFHKGSLHDSLATTIVIRNSNHLFEVISKLAQDKFDWLAEIEIQAYPSEGDNFDPRIGWYTHMVKANIYEKDVMHPVGFLSEPLDCIIDCVEDNSNE